MRKLIIAAFAVILFGCESPVTGTKVDIENNVKDYKVELLFEVDGIKVYRFYDGRRVYFTSKTGNVESEYTTGAGKTRHTHKQQTICE